MLSRNSSPAAAAGSCPVWMTVLMTQPACVRRVYLRACEGEMGLKEDSSN